MSTSDNRGITMLAKQIGDLYLSKEFSDVKIVIGNVEMPAHRMILSQRCPYFKTMFASGMIESKAKRIELHETPIDGFKLVLQWIYTGVMEFNRMATTLEVLQLSHMYELTELEKLTIQYVQSHCNIDNTCLILNNVVLLSQPSDPIYGYLETYFFDLLRDKTFLKLSKDALKVVLDYCVLEEVDDPMDADINISILKAFVRWMKANGDKSEHFPELLKMIPLYSMNFGVLLSIVPAELITGNVLVDTARLQQVASSTSGSSSDED